MEDCKCGEPWPYNEPGHPNNYYCQLPAGHGPIHDWFCFIGAYVRDNPDALELPDNVHRHGKFRFDW